MQSVTLECKIRVRTLSNKRNQNTEDEKVSGRPLSSRKKCSVFLRHSSGREENANM